MTATDDTGVRSQAQATIRIQTDLLNDPPTIAAYDSNSPAAVEGAETTLTFPGALVSDVDGSLELNATILEP